MKKIRQRAAEDAEDASANIAAPTNSAAAAAAAAAAATKKKKNKKQQQDEEAMPPALDLIEDPEDEESKPPPTVGMLIVNLNADVKQIYTDTVTRLTSNLLPSSAAAASSGKQKDDKKSSNSNSNSNNTQFFVEDNTAATMLITCPDKASAKKVAARLNRTHLFGSQPAASVVPTASLQPSYQACAVKITEMRAPSSSSATTNADDDEHQAAPPQFSMQQLSTYLKSPGFLAVKRIQTDDSGSSSSSSSSGARTYIATYADVGAALHARALLSGRAFHQTHLLFERVRNDEEEVAVM